MIALPVFGLCVYTFLFLSANGKRCDHIEPVLTNLVHVSSFPSTPDLSTQFWNMFPPYPKVDYLGGDKPADKIKATDSKEAIAYKDAVNELVKSISIMFFMGKKLEDF